MLPDLQQLFERQAAWQRARAQLSWPEKIRMAELMREAARHLRGESPGPASAALKTVKLANHSGETDTQGTAAPVAGRNNSRAAAT